MNRRVAIVGAGLAGLAAALELKEAGAHVEVFERSRLLGGRATSFEIDGHEVDNGQHVFLACCTDFIDFARRVGMEQHLHIQDRFDALILSRDGVAGRLRTGSLPAPLHMMGSFATFPHLDIAAKLQIAKALFLVIRSAGAKRRSRKTDETLSFERWLERNGQGASARRGFWDPFFIPALNAPFDKISADDAMFVLKTAFLGDAGSARFGFSQVPLAHLAAAAAARLDAMHLSTSVSSITSGPGGVTVDLSKGGDSLSFDAVVLAVPPRATAKILGTPQVFGFTDLDAYDAYPIVDVHLWHDGGSITIDFAAALESPLQWIFEKEPGYLCCSFSAADQYLRLPTVELEQLAWSEVRAFLPLLRNAGLVKSAVTRNPEATWLPRIGTQRVSQRTTRPNVAIAGAWTDTGWPDTMESAVRSGLQAARVLKQNLAPTGAIPVAVG